MTVTVTETATRTRRWKSALSTQTVTVESSVETLQTESSTLGTTVTGSTITALPMANGNYTEILSLAAALPPAWTTRRHSARARRTSAPTASTRGRTTIQMDGVAVNNIANSGSSNDGTIYTGIPIPSPDAIAEFKIQTSTYDASYGRNPGANVNVVTKAEVTIFTGRAFEFFRNSVLNSSDFFYN